MRILTDKVQNFEKEHMQAVINYAPESVVLLKNDNVLPLTNLNKIALFGNGARNTIKGGTGSGDVNVRHFTNIEEAFENSGYVITSKNWLDQYSDFKKKYVADYYDKLKKENEGSNVPLALAAMGKTPLEPDYDFDLDDGDAEAAIYVVARDSGEGTDRRAEKGDVKLTDTEKRDILALAKKYENFVLVLNTGGLVDLGEVNEQVPAILLLSQLGSATGETAVNVITGKNYPSGKLAMTWAKIEDYPSTSNFGNINDTKYKEGIYVGYRYFDSVNAPLFYEFGYGLGYTSFNIKTTNIKLEKTQALVTVKVTNIGKFAGKEVVQAYISKPSRRLDQPYQDLVAYSKTRELAPGEIEDLTIAIDFKRLGSFDEKTAQEIVEAGQYLLRIGNSSRNTHVVARFALDEDAVIKKTSNLLTKPDFKDFVPDKTPYGYTGEKDEIAAAPKYSINAADFKTGVVTLSRNFAEIKQKKPISWDEVASGKKSVEDFVAGLSVEELANLAVGNYAKSNNVMEVIGNAATTVAGAAGETTHHIHGNVPVLVMADGPAGLRLSTKYILKSDGSAEALTSSLAEAGTAAKNTKRTGEVYYQYAVAIPIGTAIAQSWNPEVAKIYGDIVGEEMETFNVDIWLAPALNIQRSPLDGRDFEYYSEDPLISGLTAAGMTNGVQLHHGKTTTIKHYVANNQETNRYFSNSEMSERTLRDIYARGFEIAVDKSHPLTLMTSYNLLNGQHTAESKKLIQDLLRDEYGFGGFVMSDWFVTGGMGLEGDKYPSATVVGNVIAGNDVTMPGLPNNVQDILSGVKNGKLNVADLQRNAVHILNVILKMKN